MENWKAIIGYEGIYEVSDLGNIRSLKRETKYIDGRIGVHKGRVLKSNLNKKGYFRIDLTKESKRTSRLVHRIVAEAFIPNPDGKEQVNHKDGNKQNNKSSNLEWVTNEENAIHANENNLRGVKQPKEVGQFDKEGNLLDSYRSIYQAAKVVGGDNYKISLVCHGKRKSHKGFVWKFL